MATEPKVESIYGQLWNLETDCIVPNIDITLNSKMRGMKVKAGIVDSIPDFKEISRKSLAILTACITSVDGVLTVMLGAGAKLLLSRACQVCPTEKAYYTQPIYKYDKQLSKDIFKYISSIRNHKDILPLERWLFKCEQELKEIIIFIDGSLGLAGYSIYFRINDCLKIVKANTKTINSSVPTSECVSRTLGLEGLHSIIMPIHAHTGNQDLNIQ